MYVFTFNIFDMCALITYYPKNSLGYLESVVL